METKHPASSSFFWTLMTTVSVYAAALLPLTFGSNVMPEPVECLSQYHQRRFRSRTKINRVWPVPHFFMFDRAVVGAYTRTSTEDRPALALSVLRIDGVLNIASREGAVPFHSETNFSCFLRIDISCMVFLRKGRAGREKIASIGR